jgi:hypothetical protein
MAGRKAHYTRRGGEIVRLCVLLIALGATARAQESGPPSSAIIGDLESVTNASESTVNPLFPQPAFPGPSAGAGGGSVPVEMGLFDTIRESLFGDVYEEGRWRPLPLSTFFTEGWFEPWASAPAGRDGLTPRHGWLGAFDAVFYRLWVTTFDYQNGIDASVGGNRYLGTYSIFLPFSRRFEVHFAVPFVVSNGTKYTTYGYTSRFGDFAITPRFMLSETAATSQTFALAIRTPTGSTSTANGIMSLTPRYEFWTNPVGAWVARGSAGFAVPMNKAEAPARTSFVGGLAVGRYFTPHDVPFGDLVLYCESNVLVPLDGAASTATVVTVGPGTRFHIAKSYFFLANWDFPVTGNRPDNYMLQVALLKEF